MNDPGKEMREIYSFNNEITTSFPGSLFYASLLVEERTKEAEKRDPGKEVAKFKPRLPS